MWMWMSSSLSSSTIKKDGVDSSTSNSSMSILKEFFSKCQISAPLGTQRGRLFEGGAYFI